MTGGRLKRLKEYIKDETFLLTYGDAVTDLNIADVVDFHKKNGKLVTVTGVRPPARFGELTINENNEVLEFKEKPNIHEGWINGGFFVMEPEFLDLIDDDSSSKFLSCMNSYIFFKNGMVIKSDFTCCFTYFFISSSELNINLSN